MEIAARKCCGIADQPPKPNCQKSLSITGDAHTKNAVQAIALDTAKSEKYVGYWNPAGSRPMFQEPEQRRRNYAWIYGRGNCRPSAFGSVGSRNQGAGRAHRWVGGCSCACLVGVSRRLNPGSESKPLRVTSRSANPVYRPRQDNLQIANQQLPPPPRLQPQSTPTTSDRPRCLGRSVSSGLAHCRPAFTG